MVQQDEWQQSQGESKKEVQLLQRREAISERRSNVSRERSVSQEEGEHKVAAQAPDIHTQAERYTFDVYNRMCV